MTDKLQMLRAPFPPHQISKLPKPYKKDSPKGKCQECGGYHGLPAMHLDYVGHAALTDRLLDTDPAWTWEPVAMGDDGLPKLDGNGGLWIRLTICGVTRLGYGDADGKTGPAAMKERIGDALRNAAMRFGAALDLWHKGDLHIEPEDEDAASKKTITKKPLEPAQAVGMAPDLLADWMLCIDSCEAGRLEALVNDGLTAATEVKDREAYQAIRIAGHKRREALESMNREKMLQNPLPVDRVAARVVFGKGEHWAPDRRPHNEGWDAPPPAEAAMPPWATNLLECVAVILRH